MAIVAYNLYVFVKNIRYLRFYWQFTTLFVLQVNKMPLGAIFYIHAHATFYLYPNKPCKDADFESFFSFNKKNEY